MADGAPQLQLIEQTESSVLAVSGNLVVKLHDRQMTTAGMARLGRAFDETLLRHPGGICVLWISLTRRTNPNEQAMRDRLEVIQRPGDRLLGLAFVTERGGIASAIKRTAAAEVRDQCGPARERLGIFQSLEQGIAYIEPHMQGAPARGELLARLEGLWGEDRPGRGRLPLSP